MSNVINFNNEVSAVVASAYNKLLDRENCELTTTFEIKDLLEKIPETASDLGLHRSMLTLCLNQVEQHEAQRLANAVMMRKSDENAFAFTVNMAYEGPIALYCPAQFPVRIRRLPEIGCYGSGSMPMELSYIRIHSLFLDRIPDSIKQVLSREQINKCDFIFHACRTSYLENIARKKGLYPRYNFRTHAWVHPRAQNGEDCKKFPDMGIFEPINIVEIKGKDGISFCSLKPMEVYVHPIESSMALSPNNGHFAVVEGAPFSAFWHVTVCEERTLITRQWIINDEKHPLSAVLERSFNDARCVSDHLSTLKFQKEGAMQVAKKRLEKIACAFSGSDHLKAFTLFEKLSQGEKNRIYLLAYKEMGEKPNIHHDFGRASFHGTEDLALEHRCSSEQRAMIILQLLKEQLESFGKVINEQESLFTAPKGYPELSPERARKEKLFRPILEKLRGGNRDSAREQFLTLPQSDQKKVFERVWELKKCPMGIHDDFGRAAYFSSNEIDSKYHCTVTEQRHAINIYLNQ